MTQYEIDTKYNKAVDLYYSKDYQDAYQIYLELAKIGDIDSQNTVARLLQLGKGVKKDIDEGYQWYEKSAKQGSPLGQCVYGNYCLDIDNEKEGLSYIEKSAKLELPRAIYTLATVYDHGHYGYSQDREKALEMYKKAFSLGEKRAFRAFLNLYKEENGKLQMALYMIKNFSWMREALSKAT